MKILVITLLLLSTPAFARMPINNYICAEASELIKRNDCAGVKGGCDCALKKTLELGCRIQWWNHIPQCPNDNGND